MTIPNGPDGVKTGGAIGMTSAYGHGDMSIADLVGNDEETVKAAFKNRYLGSDDSVWANPSGPLAQVFSKLNAVPGVGFVSAMAQQMFAGIFDALGNFPVIGQGFKDIGYFLGLTRKQATTADTKSDTANVGLAILTARVNKYIVDGASFTDTFARDVAEFSQDPDYDVHYEGGSGYLYVSAAENGILRWSDAGGGFTDTSFIARRKTPMGTNKVRASVIINDFTYGYAGNQSHVRIMGRMDAARANYVLGVIEDGWAEIGVVRDGVYTRLGPVEQIVTNPGDLWDWEMDVDDNPFKFRLVQNNAPRVVRTDVEQLSRIDTDPGVDTGVYNFCAIGGDCAIGAGAFGTTYQIGMPDFQVFTGGDY